MKLRPVLAITSVLFILAISLPLAAICKLYVSQADLIMPRTVNSIPLPNPAEANYRQISIPTPDGATLNGILYPAQVSSPTLILTFGGNAQDVVGMANFLKTKVFPETDIAVAAFSYRGYPNVFHKPSTGTPSEKTLYADSLTIYDALNTSLHPQRTYAIGYSLGTAVSTYLSTQRQLEGIVLIAPPASIRRLAQEQYPWVPVRLLINHPFATEDMLGNVSTSVTLIYTPSDGLIPPHHLDILKRANPTAEVIRLQGSTHGTILDNPELPAHLRKTVISPISGGRG